MRPYIALARLRLRIVAQPRDRVLVVVATHTECGPAMQTLSLNTNWAWKQRNSSISSVIDETCVENLSDNSKDDPTAGWRTVKAFPCEVHVELLHSGLIPDPYVGFNEHKVQWVGQAEWLYKTTFASTGDTPSHTILEFLGLDTICDVYLASGLFVFNHCSLIQSEWKSDSAK